MRDTPLACDTMRDRMRDGLKARPTATWTNAPLVRSARGAGARRRRRRAQNQRGAVRSSGAKYAQNGLQEGRGPASRLSPHPLAKRETPIPSAFYDVAPLPHRLCCSASAEAAHFFEAPRSFEFLFAPLALTLGSRPRQSRLGQTGGQSSATTPRVYNQTRTTTS